MLGLGLCNPNLIEDNEAQAFITAAGISDPTQQSAITTLVSSLKSAGIWEKIHILYPMVGGTATSHKYNLKDPRDLDVAYRLTFNGGWTHSATGALPNGVNGYARTYFSPNTLTYNSSYHQVYYSRTNGARTGTVEMGLLQNGVTTKPSFYMYVRTSDVFGGRVGWNTTHGGEINTASLDSRGFFSNTKTGTTSDLHRNGVHQTTLSGWTSTETTAGEIYIGAYHDVQSDTPAGYTNRECALTGVGLFLTEAEILAYYNAVQAFQTTLGRNV